MQRKVFVIGVLVLLAIMLFSIFSQSDLDDFETEFIEIATVRNENNTGPVQPVYIITVDRFNQEEMQRYGQLMPHSKLGNTKVYFFSAADPHPKEGQSGDVNFEEIFNSYCLAKFEKRFGYEGFLLNPFQ